MAQGPCCPCSGYSMSPDHLVKVCWSPKAPLTTREAASARTLAARHLGAGSHPPRHAWGLRVGMWVPSPKHCAVSGLSGALAVNTGPHLLHLFSFCAAF